MVCQVMPYKILAYGLSDIGQRQNNEDVWAQLPEEAFFALADGMGGHQAGEVAAREAVNHACWLFKQRLAAASDKSLQGVSQILREVIKQVNEIIYDMGSQQTYLRGMGTTLCCVYIHSDGLIYGHVGDSRIYLLRKKTLQQLTQDHSLLRELIDLGQLDEQQADEFHYKNIITKAIGTEPFVEGNVQTMPLSPGDIILMCSDGLSDPVQSEEIQHIMTHVSDREMGKQLIKAAKQRGGYDNVTVVIIKVQEKYGDKTHLP